MNQLKIANRNIKLYVFIKVFAKRVFIPLTAIYFIDFGGFTIRDIGLLAAFYSVVQLLAEVPTGYFADKAGRITSIRIGALLAATATAIYALVHTKTGIFAGSMMEALGYSFLGGAGEALIHDSLVVKKQEHDYTRILSKAQSISLVANAILLALVPMTYAINPKYPFIIGTIAYLSLFSVALFMHDVTKASIVLKIKIPDIRKISGKKNLLLFGISFGIIAALYSSPVDMYNVALREYGIHPEYLGWVYGLSSVVGAAIGPFIHYLRKIKLSNYLILDIGILLSVYLAASTRSAIFLALTMIIGVGFWRYRRIIYQSYLLNLYPTQYKATLVSAMNNTEQLNSIWITLLITFTIFHTNISKGLGLIGLFALIVAPVFFVSARKFFHRDPVPVPTPLANMPTDIV